MCNIEMSDSAKELLEENDGYAPIIVGADYKDVVKIGSKYIDNESGKQYIVVDILLLIYCQREVFGLEIIQQFLEILEQS